MRIIVGVTGGIAAYKSAGLVRLLVEAGHSVQVVTTQNALKFIGAATLEALSKNPVESDLWSDVESVKHIDLAKSADLVIVAPATASFIARYAAGLADDLLGNILLATEAKVTIAPAMHTEMWQHEATMANIALLRSRGVEVIEPDSGRLTGTDSGIGRLPEPESIIAQALSSPRRQDLMGKKILVTAGGTQEPIDPVRFIGNRSSGKQGIAIATAARDRGAEVLLITANLEQKVSGINTLTGNSAVEMKTAVDQNLEWSDCLIMTAAVADYSPEKVSGSKLKKESIGQEQSLVLTQNADILASASKVLRQNGKISVGFAAETTTDLDQAATEKLKSKGCSILVANDVSNGKVFGEDSTSVLIITELGDSVRANGSKLEVAHKLLDVISDML
jgi:phosphopantothenoylcysteine decarboxylase/phosphopantothenate--cysteine ligase